MHSQICDKNQHRAKELQIREATIADIPRLIELLHQVNMVHHDLRPDLFKPQTTKYDEVQLSDKMEDINCLRASIPALDQLIEGLSRQTK